MKKTFQAFFMISHFAEKNLIFRNSQRREFVLTSPGIMFYENTCRVEKQNHFRQKIYPKPRTSFKVNKRKRYTKYTDILDTKKLT